MSYLFKIINSVLNFFGITQDNIESFKNEVKTTAKEFIKDEVLEKIFKERFSRLYSVSDSIYKVLGKEVSYSKLVKNLVYDKLNEVKQTRVDEDFIDLLSASDTTKKNLVKGVLAYAVHSGDISLDEIKESQLLANTVGYAKPENLAKQVEVTLKRIVL